MEVGFIGLGNIGGPCAGPSLTAGTPWKPPESPPGPAPTGSRASWPCPSPSPTAPPPSS